MTDGLKLARLMSWLSPVFPTGSFAYSSGLEAAVASDVVMDEYQLKEWLISLMTFGRLRNDAIYLGAARQEWHSEQAINEINQIALAATGSAELHMETVAQGQAFVDAIIGWSGAMHFNFPDEPCLPVAVGAACGSADIGAHSAIIAFAHAFLANQLQMAIRLSVMGQAGAAQILADLETHIIEFAGSAETATIEDLGNATIMADILSMRHETQDGRMFRS